MKYFSDRPFNYPEVAARKLLDLVRNSISTSGLPCAYTGAVNLAFTRAGGKPTVEFEAKNLREASESANDSEQQMYADALRTLSFAVALQSGD